MSNRDTSCATLLSQQRNRIQASFYKQRPTFAISSQELLLQIQTGTRPIHMQYEGSNGTIPACNCVIVNDPPPVTTTMSPLTRPGTLNTIATYLRNYMPEFRNSNFWAYKCDGDVTGNYIQDGSNDMYDSGNVVTPWLLSGSTYLDSNWSNLDAFFPYHVSYSTITETSVDTDFKYISLGWIKETLDYSSQQIDQSAHPLTVMGYRESGPVGWQIGGNIGADGGGSLTSGYVYNNVVINGFRVYAGHRQTYNATDPVVCSLIILLGHPSWNSAFGPITLYSDPSTDAAAFYMYSGVGSQNILGVYILLSKPDDGTPIPNSELQTVIANLTLRIKESLQL
jgi:hypothetical protein